MRSPLPRALVRLLPWLPFLGLVALVPLEALARGGGGEHYSSGRDSGGDGGGGGIPIEILYFIVRLTVRYPHIMLPILGIGGLVWYLHHRNNNPTGTTQRALERREAELRTRASPQDVQAWVSTLRGKDPSFELQPLLDKVRTLFLSLQDAWFQRDMSPVRPFLSDATFQRFQVQLQLLQAQGVRDAITDIEVLDLQLLGLEQSQWFDSLHVRVHARMRDTDVPASTSDAEAVAAAKRAPLESFTEVWTFVRKPGAQTRIGQDLFQGKCPNCGAPYSGGASNRCEYCNAIVNSGNYDWVLSEITQGIEHARHPSGVRGLAEARQVDPALNLEVLEDRASLLFWKWVDAQSRGATAQLHKVAHADALSRLDEELSSLRQQHRRKVFLECAVGSVVTRSFELHPEALDRVCVEIRWSARMGIGPEGERPPALPTLPMRQVFTLVRKHGARTSTDNGMSTDRCPSCHAPLTNSASVTCDYCGTSLGSGDADWVLLSVQSFEEWNSQEHRHVAHSASRRNVMRGDGGTQALGSEQALGASSSGPGDEVIADPQERQRLLYMMAALASADGSIEPSERKLLELCSRRWSIPWSNVQMALNAGPQLFTRLVPRGSPAAEVFLRNLVEMALVDGRIDRKERRMLEFAAEHLDMAHKLQELIRGR